MSYLRYFSKSRIIYLHVLLHTPIIISGCWNIFTRSCIYASLIKWGKHVTSLVTQLSLYALSNLTVGSGGEGVIVARGR